LAEEAKFVGEGRGIEDWHQNDGLGLLAYKRTIYVACATIAVYQITINTQFGKLLRSLQLQPLANILCNCARQLIPM
jgi:hypothetical protein